MSSKSRKAHMLDELKATTHPSNVLFFDTETWEEKRSDIQVALHLRLGVAVHCRTRREECLMQQSELTFKDKANFWDYVEKACKGNSVLYLVAHNIVFDTTILDGFVELPKRGWKLDSFYIKNPVAILRWSNGKRKIRMIDNGNLFAGRLADWGYVAEQEKGKVDFKTVSEGALEEYCRGDVEIMVKLWRQWFAFLDDNDCGAFKQTTSSTAMSTWRHRFMQHPVYIHNDIRALSLERAAYHGGRVECLYQGKRAGSTYYYLDVNNMYGQVLAAEDYPTGWQRSYSRVAMETLEDKLIKYAVVARVTVTVNENWFPYVVNGHMCYPLGTFTTVLTTPELILAQERGWIDAVHELACYHKAELFSDYVKYFGSKREEYRLTGKPGFAANCKLLVNGFYGKWGQQAFSQKIVGDAPLEATGTLTLCNTVTRELYRQVTLGGHVYEEHKTGEAYHSFPAIAAHVTANARLLLFKLCRTVPTEHVFYMDTDSLLVDQVGYEALEHLIEPGVMGKLKIECQGDSIEIRAPKDYLIGERDRTKGKREDALQLDENTYQQDRFSNLPGMIRSGNVSEVTVTQTIKHLERRIYSGVAQPDGWIAPFLLRPLERMIPVEFSRESVLLPISRQSS